MSKYEEKDFLELLEADWSDGTKKARRNVSAIAFVVIVMFVLGVDVNEIRFLGVNLSGTSIKGVLFFALLIAGYWLIIFLISMWRDVEIQKERREIIERLVEGFHRQLLALDDTDPAFSGSTVGANIKRRERREELETMVSMYEMQQTRTSSAVKLAATLKQIETKLPILLGLIAIILLSVGMFFDSSRSSSKAVEIPCNVTCVCKPVLSGFECRDGKAISTD